MMKKKYKKLFKTNLDCLGRFPFEGIPIVLKDHHVQSRNTFFAEKIEHPKRNFLSFFIYLHIVTNCNV